MEDKRQLFCTFSNTSDFKKTIDCINEFYEVYKQLIYVFYNTKNIKELFITYNLINERSDVPKFQNTISIHRKKQTNSLYTLNAMNKIICDENGGVFDKTFRIKWENYRDSLIITDKVFVKVISIKIYDIIS